MLAFPELAETYIALNGAPLAASSFEKNWQGFEAATRWWVANSKQRLRTAAVLTTEHFSHADRDNDPSNCDSTAFGVARLAAWPAGG